MAKKLLFLALTMMLSIKSFSQITFETGYYINDSDKIVECLIKNIDWKNNPTEFEFKLSQDATPQSASIETVKEFGIINESKYIREKVKIDRSTDLIERMGTAKTPKFLEETLFLKVLVEGEASLFLYEDGDLKRFFYTINDNKTQQLVYKRYLLDNQVAQNNYFKQQLLNDLRCENIKQHEAERLKYINRDLEKFFIKFNECSSGSYINYEIKEKRDLFNVSIRPGLNYSNLSIHHSTVANRETDFDAEVSFRFGIEAEFIFPFNKNKWSVIIEPTYQYYTSEKTTESSFVNGGILISSTNYRSIELPIGLRHYFFLKNKSKIFVNLVGILDFSNNSSIDFTRSDGTHHGSLNINTGSNLGMGIGYKHKDKYGVELRYQTSRAVFRDYLFWRSDYQTISMIFGYSLL